MRGHRRPSPCLGVFPCYGGPDPFTPNGNVTFPVVMAPEPIAPNVPEVVVPSVSYTTTSHRRLPPSSLSQAPRTQVPVCQATPRVMCRTMEEAHREHARKPSPGAYRPQ